MPHATVVDVLLLLTRDDTVLLARRRNTGYADGQWNLPSGKLEQHEHVIDAMLRETREEIGLSLSPNDIRMVTSIHYRAPEGHARIGFVFHADGQNMNPVNQEPEKCSALDWFPMNELPDPIVPYTAAAIEMFCAGIQFGVCGWSDSAGQLP
ncbi:NUDIX domain-containing protein [Nocardia panacis]|uniref:NUDIX domain-containing protein n=1 Tax=Nocardia panacis TaxID=2340916 RepID=A0A3A4KBY0_9NOCA|nr:NUDIX domain-containing protein [Nocardia panacis]RJO79367.1 NUDIX domain-containing protein [Nocardia panacis]